jgi:hypothetical protein
VAPLDAGAAATWAATIITAVVATLALARTVRNDLLREGQSDGAVREELDRLKASQEAIINTMTRHLIDCAEARGELRKQYEALTAEMQRIRIPADPQFRP